MIPANMKEVSKDEFFATVGQLDVIGEFTRHTHPYAKNWKLRYGKVVGHTDDQYTDGIERKYPIITKYYLVK